MSEVDVSIMAGPVRHLPVPVTTVDITIGAPFRRFYGWSLREASGDASAAAEGSVTSPAAGQTIATTANLNAGTYNVTWSVELAGTLAAADSNNFELLVGATVIQVSVNPAVAGVYPQGQVEVAVPAATAVLVKAVALGTVGAVYSAAIQVTPVITDAYQVEWQDNGDMCGESSAGVGETDTQYFGTPGVELNGTLKLHVISGAVTGTVYVSD